MPSTARRCHRGARRGHVEGVSGSGAGAGGVRRGTVSPCPNDANAAACTPEHEPSGSPSNRPDAARPRSPAPAPARRPLPPDPAWPRTVLPDRDQEPTAPLSVPAPSHCCAATRTREILAGGTVVMLTVHATGCAVWTAR